MFSLHKFTTSMGNGKFGKERYILRGYIWIHLDREKRLGEKSLILKERNKVEGCSKKATYGDRSEVHGCFEPERCKGHKDKRCEEEGIYLIRIDRRYYNHENPEKLFAHLEEQLKKFMEVSEEASKWNNFSALK